MTYSSPTTQSGTIAAMAIVAGVLALHAADPPNFKPDGVFKGSTLAGWHVVGDVGAAGCGEEIRG